MSENISITFEESYVDPYMLDIFGWHSDDSGWVRDGNGEHAPTSDGDPITTKEVAGVITGEDGDPVLLRDSFPELVDYVSERRYDDD